MHLMKQATLAVACIALSSATFAQVRGIYVVPDDGAAKGGNNVRSLVLACEKFDSKATKDTAVKCTYIPPQRENEKITPAVTDRPAVGLFWVSKHDMLCAWIGGRWVPPGCR